MKKKLLKHFLFNVPIEKHRKILVMANLILFFTLFNLQLQAGLMKYNVVSLDLKDATLYEMFESIEAQTELGFLYNETEINITEKICVEAKDEPLITVLGSTLPELGIDYKINESVIILTPKVEEPEPKVEIVDQQKIVTGIVTSAEDASSLPGVTIRIVGTNTGVTTDMNGSYNVSVPGPTSQLEFSFIGFESQIITVGQQSVINVTLERSILDLEEVVVTGLAGATDKKKLTFTLEQVNAEAINKVPVLNVASALQGKVPGVRIAQDDAPGGGVEILLRGATSLRTENGPLVVIDGVLTTGTIRDINIQDVANIEILKGASAASLYGSRAANGVIAIYSKRGLENAVGTTSIRIKSEIGFETIYQSRRPDKTNHHAWLTNPDGSIMLDESGRGVPDPINIYDNPFKTTYDNLKRFFTGSPYTTNFVEVSSRAEKSNVLFSAEYAKRAGALKYHDGNDRINLRLNADQYLGKKVKLSASALLIKQHFDQSTTDIENLIMSDPSDDLLKPNPTGEPFNVAGNKFVNPYSYMNPLYILTNTDAERDRYRVLGNFEATYFINDEFSFDSRYGLDYYQNFSKFFRDKGYLAVSEGTQYNGYIRRTWSDEMAVTATQQLNYMKNIDDVLNIKARLFYQYESNKNNGFEATADSVGSVVGFNHFDAVPDANRRIFMAYSTSPNEVTGHNFALAGSFDYLDKYLFDFVVRREGISLFGEDQRWQTFYRVSGGYRLTEDFQIPKVQELSLRASYGTAGGRPLFLDQYEYAVVNNGTPTLPSQKSNPDLKPNITSELELSLNAQFLDRFSLKASYSAQENRDQILRLSLSAASGYSSQVVNAGTLSTNTFELSLGAQVIRQRDVSLNFNLIMDRTRQKVTKFEPTPYFDDLQWIKEGNSLTAMYGQKFATTLAEVENQLPEGETLETYFTTNRDGYIIQAGTEYTADEKVYRILDDKGIPINTFKIGDAAPDLSLGLITDFRFRAFSLSMVWGAQIGGNVYNQGAQRMTQFGLSGITDQAGYPEGQRKYGAYFQSIYNAVQYVDYWVADASFLKLRELSVSYNIDKNMLRKLNLDDVFKNIRFSLTGRNLFVFSKYTGFDPETGGINSRLDYFNYPLVRAYTGSIEISF